MLEYELWIQGASSAIYFDDYAALVYYLNNTLPANTVATCKVHTRTHKYTWVFNGPDANPMPQVPRGMTAPQTYTRTHMKRS